MATSGTVATTTFETRKVIDHAFRRCKLAAQQVTSEHLNTASELLWLVLQSLNQRGLLLNAIQQQYLGLNEGVVDLQTGPGTLNILSANLRQMSRIAGTASSSSGTAANAFDGDLTTACTQVVTLGSITSAFTSASPLSMVGVLPAAGGTWSFVIQTSQDGSSWTTQLTVTNQSVTTGTWLWYELQGIPSTSYARIVATGTTVLNVTELVFANTPQDTPIPPIDRDTYDFLPNKRQGGRPVQYWFNRQRTTALMTLYPPPSSAYVVTYCVVVRVQRQLMDVGTLIQELELPNRWYLPIVAELARHLAAEIKEVDAGLAPVLGAEADRLLAMAWDGETDSAPATLLPNIRVYQG